MYSVLLRTSLLSDQWPALSKFWAHGEQFLWEDLRSIVATATGSQLGLLRPFSGLYFSVLCLVVKTSSSPVWTQGNRRPSWPDIDTSWPCLWLSAGQLGIPAFSLSQLGGGLWSLSLAHMQEWPTSFLHRSGACFQSPYLSVKGGPAPSPPLQHRFCGITMTCNKQQSGKLACGLQGLHHVHWTISPLLVSFHVIH